MADLVGRTISATSASPGRPPQSASGGGDARRHASVGRAAAAAPGDAGGGASYLYTLAETAMMNVPAGAETANLRPTEVAKLNDMLERTWESMRAWLESHTNEAERQAAAMHQGQFLTTALHMVCKLPEPPADVVRSLLECAEGVASWPDSNGWLPLHHAVANGACGKVLSALVRAHPEGKVVQDKRLRTPLHFAFFRKDSDQDSDAANDEEGEEGLLDDDDVGNSLGEIVALLADSGAAEMQDEGGMLPLHYAGAYGTTREVLEVLLENYPESITKRENKGRNALHLAMVNAHRESSPKVVEFLLEKDAAAVLNSYDDDRHLPIHLLAMASKFPEEKVAERENAAGCLELYLNAKPKASADFLTAVQTLPEWLRDIAVLNDHIQDILNHKIVMRFPTMILILDAFFLILVIVVFEVVSTQTIDHLFTKDHEDADVKPEPPANKGLIFMTFISGAYFLLREVVQIISLLTLGNVSSWFTDMENWLDALLIFFIFYFGSVMMSNDPLISKEAFRTGVAIAKGVMWGSVISYLKSVKVEFSVFVSGVFYVVQQLTAFLTALAVILVMFAQMYYLLYSDSAECLCTEAFPDANPFPHCEFFPSLLYVYLMLMGNIGNEMRYSTVPLAMFLYFVSTFIVIILLSNVLIAIVTDSYGVIKNERAAMVFWANRLDYVAEMDAIKNMIKKITCRGEKDAAPPAATETTDGDPMVFEQGRKGVTMFANGWQSIMNLFDPNLYETYDVSPSSFEFWCYFLVRFAAVVVVIPVWLVAGLCTAGLLWPPQVREYLLKQKKVAEGRADTAEQVKELIADLKTELVKHQKDVRSEMKTVRKEFTQVKTEVEAVQAEVMADLLQVKEIMVTLLEMSRDHLDTVDAAT